MVSRSFLLGTLPHSYPLSTSLNVMRILYLGTSVAAELSETPIVGELLDHLLTIRDWRLRERVKIA